MPTFSQRFDTALRAENLRAENLLAHAEKYLAHIPKPSDPADKKAETLGEHLELVLQHTRQISQLHGLAQVAERLTGQVVEQLKFENPKMAEDWLLTLFANAIVFHDFGKVNEFFQTDRMKNTDPSFQSKHSEIFTPRYGHSELGAFLFNVYHLEKLFELRLPDDEALKYASLTLLFSNTILLHHSPRLKKPHERISHSQFIKFHDQLSKYLQLYRNFPTARTSNMCFEHFDTIIEDFERLNTTDFALFTLLRLNFSLLTASDYMATWHYGYEMGLITEQHWGVFSDAKRAALIHSARTQKEYNALAYQYFEDQNYILQHPTEPNAKNLNVLRTEMTVEMLRQMENNRDQRLFYLEAPTGGGKTNLSMLAVAELLRANPELNKVFYVFPFTTLITQTHRSIKETLRLDDDDIALLHSRAGFQTLREFDKNPDGETDMETQEDGVYGDKKRDFLQNLFVLYPFTLLTHIRFFDILKSDRKDNIYLMHRLANSVVILDELQSYPPRQWDKMLFLLNEYSRYFNIRFILMSATLPRLDKIEAVRRAAKSPLPKVIDLLPEPRRYFLNPNFRGRVTFRFDLLGDSGNTEIALSELAAVVLEKSRARAELPESEGRVFTMVEFIFKKSATEFRIEFAQMDRFFDEIFVLSGTILESRRREIIAFLKRNQLAKNLKVLLITTQVVEAGVDIDMDLGFKNISLIDSDEQLAGRVNRNVNKKGCEVWLFKANESMVLYGKDFRFEAMRNMSADERRQVLEDKDFGKLYDRVFARIEQQNSSVLVENFEDDYLPLFQGLDFRGVHEKFKLIDQQTLSVFVPLSLPLKIENENGDLDDFFSENERRFLEKSGVWAAGDSEIEGAAVWRFYRNLCENKEKPMDYVNSKIEQKTLQGILSKFTFSTFDSPKNRLGLRCFCDETDCFENYFVLTRYNDLYRLDSGLDESKLHNADNFF